VEQNDGWVVGGGKAEGGGRGRIEQRGGDGRFNNESALGALERWERKTRCRRLRGVDE